MNKYQKKVLIIVFSILVLIAVVAVIYSFLIKRNETNLPSENPSIPNQEKNLLNKEMGILDDYDEFFTVSNIINNYYEVLSSKNANDLLNLLDEDYKTELGIQSYNVLTILGNDYNGVTFTPWEIYYNKDSVITYYFINGYIEEVNYVDDSSIYKESVNFLVIVNKQTKNYALRPLNDNIIIKDYAYSYNLVEKNLKYNSYKDIDTSIDTVLITYLNVFRDLLFLDNEKAYNMLDDSMIDNYQNVEDFYMHSEEIYEYIPSNVFGYSVIQDNEQKIYKIIDEKQNEFIIYEYGIMNYKISY